MRVSALHLGLALFGAAFAIGVSTMRPRTEASAVVQAPVDVETPIPSCGPPTADQRVIAFENGSMVPVCEDVYVEDVATNDERESLTQAYVGGARAVEDALGARRGPRPLAIFCKTDPCRRWFGGTHRRSRALSPGESAPGGRYVAGDRPTVLVLRVDEQAMPTLIHELVHIESHSRVNDSPTPQWFEEGLAIHISRAPDCADQPPKGVDDLRSLDSGSAWDEHTNVVSQQHATYCQAGAEVDAWVAARGRDRLMALLAAVEEGASFYAEYGALAICDGGHDCSGPLGAAPPGRIRSYALDDGSGDVARGVDPAHRASLVGGAKWTAGPSGSAVALKGGSFVRSDAIAALGVVDQPLTLSMWVKPEKNAGVLVHASADPSGGNGWCAPLLGFDASGRWIGQILYGRSPQSFLSASCEPLPVGVWSHVAMTWEPERGVRLYVGGELACSADPKSRRQKHFAAPSGKPLFLTYGTDQGAACWTGGIAPAHFAGAIDALEVFNYELSPAQVADESKR